MLFNDRNILPPDVLCSGSNRKRPNITRSEQVSASPSGSIVPLLFEPSSSSPSSSLLIRDSNSSKAVRITRRRGSTTSRINPTDDALGFPVHTHQHRPNGRLSRITHSLSPPPQQSSPISPPTAQATAPSPQPFSPNPQPSRLSTTLETAFFSKNYA